MAAQFSDPSTTMRTNICGGGTALLRHVTVALAALTVLASNARLSAAFVAGPLPICGPATSRNDARGRRDPPNAAAASEGEERTARRDEDHGYSPEPDAGPVAPECRFTESQIHTLLLKRRQCQRLRMYKEADLILSGLNKGGVYVHDKRREWRADGPNHFGRAARYVMRGGTGGLSEEDVAAASGLVEDRSAAKRRREYHRSDEIGDVLKSRYGVRVNDRNREWSVAGTDGDGAAGDDGAAYVPSPLAPPDHPTHTMDEDTKAKIARLLADRVACRREKDYKSADRIRDELRDRHSVVADDRTREWKVVVGDVEEDEFAREARLSQRSAFARRGNR